MDHSQTGKLGYEKTKDILQAQSRQRTQWLIDEYEKSPKVCKQCGTKIPFEKRGNVFCDQSCAASHNNRAKVRRFKRTNTCINCGNPTKERHNKYCPECIESRVYNKASSLEDAKDARSRKRIIIEQRGWQCALCGLSEWMGKPIPIELDHVDGDADNNADENLRLICPNCHAQTNTYKGANVGKGSSRQKKCRQRYAEGKTY